MGYTIQINKRFEINIRKVYAYLAVEFDYKTADEFLEQLYIRIYSLTVTPHSGIVTAKKRNIRKIIISKHNKVYYRIKGKTIIILALFPSKVSPAKNRYE